jgi:hypothetical protein
MTIKERIKPLLNEKEVNFEELAASLKIGSRALHNKLSRDSLKYYDVEQILNVLGYDIQWIKRKE